MTMTSNPLVRFDDPTLTALTIMRAPPRVAGKKQTPATIAVAHFDVQPYSPLASAREQLPGITTSALYSWFAIYWTDDTPEPRPDVRLQDDLQDPTLINPFTGQPTLYHVYGVQDWGDHIEIRAQVQTSTPTT